MMFSHYNYWKWYFLAPVKFEIIKYTKDRESALITWDKQMAIRMLKIHSVQHIDVYLKAWDWYRNKWNIYSTLARYENGIPNQTLKLYARDNTEWKQNHFKEMVAYDLLIDIDASNHSEISMAADSAALVCERFDKYNIPYTLLFSGCGFHVKVPYSFFSDKKYSFDRKSTNNIYSVYSAIAKRLNDEYSEMIDINLNDSRRLCKVPYSLAIYKNYIYVCCPIDKKELKHFDISSMLPENVFRRLNGQKKNN